MQPKTRGWMVSVGALVAMIGGIVTALFFFQPWRSCPSEDMSAGCAMLPLDATLMTTAALLTVVGIVVLVVGLASKEVDTKAEVRP